MKKNPLGHLIKSTRKAQKISQFELRDLSGISPSVIYKLEQGRTDVTLSSLLAVADSLGIRVTCNSPLGEEIELHE